MHHVSEIFIAHIYCLSNVSIRGENNSTRKKERELESYNVYSSLYLIVLLKPQIFVFQLLSAYLGDQLTSIDLAEMSSVYKSNGSHSS